MNEIAITFAILGFAVALFIWNRLPVGVVALGVAVSLWATGVLDLGQALAGFGDPTVIFIASLFVVSEALDATGITTWAGQLLMERAGASRTRLLVLMMVLVALLTALISVNGSVAALIPMVMVLAVRLKWSPSKLLMPLAFAAHAGSMLSLTGTPVNILVSEAAATATGRGFGFFEFALAGIPLLAASIAVVVLLGDRLLPERSPSVMPPDLSRHAHTLVEEYHLSEGVTRLRVRDTSPLVGMERAGFELAEYPGLSLVGIYGVSAAVPAAPVGGEGGGGAPCFSAGDIVVVQGSAEAVAALAAEMHLAIRPGAEQMPGELFSQASGLAEVIVPPRSPLLGEQMTPGMVTPSGNLVLLAIKRQGETLGPGAVELAQGDTLLLQGTWDALDDTLDEPDVIVVDSPDLVRRQAVPLGPGARTTLVILVAMIVALASGVVPAAVAGLIAACAVVLTGVLSPTKAYRAISWTTVVLVAGMMSLSVAMAQTGAADLVAKQLIDVVGTESPYALIAGLFVLTAVFSQLISNMATALIVVPIALAAAADAGIAVQPVLMSISVAASAAYLTPVATPANMMIMQPAGYRFADYWKLGGVLLACSFVIAVFVVPLIWPF